MALPLPWRNPIEPHTRHEWVEQSPARLYDILDAYYGNLDVYEDVQAALWERGLYMPGMKAIRNPAFRTVEFYASKLWPGALPAALPIVAAQGGELNAAIVPAIHQVWTWSNWGAQKQVAARQLATLGDLFIKVAQTDDRRRVFFQLIHPKDVIEFDTDERGFITYIRIDVMHNVRDGDKVKEQTLTEVWDKTEFRRWHHTRGAGARTDALGTPEEQVPLSSFGIDFVPVVHTMFRDVGRDRGVGAFTPALDKIDEANRMATRLHQMLFRNSSAVWAMSANALDLSLIHI